MTTLSRKTLGYVVVAAGGPASRRQLDAKQHQIELGWSTSPSRGYNSASRNLDRPRHRIERLRSRRERD
jgi:hypothetical protein